jgi:hypothetical protein
MSALENYLNWIPRLVASCASIRFLLLAIECCIELEKLQCMGVLDVGL